MTVIKEVLANRWLDLWVLAVSLAAFAVISIIIGR
jgi:hypothetical protein